MADVSQKAVLIKLSVSQWTARKYDKRVTHEIAANHGVQADAGRYNKVLIESSEIKKISKAVNAARSFFYANTLPWSDEYRIRPTQGYMEFMTELSELEGKFSEKVHDFCNMYLSLQRDAMANLKDMHNPDDYPTVSELRRKFGFSISVLPLAGSQDFRIDLSKEEVQKIGEQLDKQNKRALQGAMKTAWTRIYEAVRHMADKLNNGDSVFRNSLVENLEELTQILPVLNIANDPELTRICDEVDHQLCSYDPDTLRKDETARVTVCRKAHSLAATIEGVLEEKEEEEDMFDSIINM